MKRSVIVIAMLFASSFAASAADSKVAAIPVNATINTGQQIVLEAFCNVAPCNLVWVPVLSNSNVGSLDQTTGPKATFTAGSASGEAYIIVVDSAKNGATMIHVTVQNAN